MEFLSIFPFISFLFLVTSLIIRIVYLRKKGIRVAFLTLISVHFFILKEENFLRKHYGEAYRKYQQKVSRYF